MRFEGRDLPTTGNYVKASDLREGETYFRVGYSDPELCVPRLIPVVYVGRNLQPGDDGNVYFQDIDSYTRGARVTDIDDVGDSDEEGTLQRFSDNTPAVFEYEHAVDELLRCSLRRRDAGK